MTHELKKIVKAYEQAAANNIKCVLATVVALDGSSYRRPGVRMLLQEDGKMVGAVSGGCVEKEVFLQAASVFKSKVAKVMTYDGRYRLGCEGILYILLEYFEPNAIFLETFWSTIKNRKNFLIESYFQKEHLEDVTFGSVFKFEDQTQPLQNSFSQKADNLIFSHTLNPCFKMIIIGAEHDAVQLCGYASMTGWEVTVVANPKEGKTLTDFPGATDFLNTDPETLRLNVDKQTAVVLMTHSYVKDLQYLISLKNERPAYFGLLGPARRREKLFDDLIERFPNVSEEFIAQIHGPAGIAVGAETPQEIAVSVVAEILSVTNKVQPILLKEKSGRIHA
ncbi:XdhC family protein [Croceitalea rosinachiae]|uniref:XdhC family protein n=1 Tax=Croceitalea rosinachiae TaxID=3075596 RepID=A0ABU3ABL1_9FLAO|nr:XdhC family protein [Croceitalea sp. F388]MDT0607566.1 XdhC family protein [Croceitalea sp. F388]